MTPTEDELRRLIDENAIRRVIYRYARGIDRRDLALIRSCYHADAIDEHGPYHGDVGGFIAWVETGFASGRLQSSFHHVGNILIEVEGEEARAETYCTATHRIIEDGELHDFILDVRSLDDFRRHDGEWRIARRRIVYENAGRTMPVAEAARGPGPGLAFGFLDDPSAGWIGAVKCTTGEEKAPSDDPI